MRRREADLSCTLVVGVDKRHLVQLSWTWPTWARHKPDLLRWPMIVFYDRTQVTDDMVRGVVAHASLRTHAWPPDGVQFRRMCPDRFGDPQRCKMLAGFVHTAARLVDTPWWLKLDTDVVATGVPDWVDLRWFRDGAAIVAHGWSYTKPPDQMEKLDAWVEHNAALLPNLAGSRPLRLVAQPGSDRLRHRRITSWCGFFDTEFTAACATAAERTCGPCQLPCPSQDGYMWYVAKRMCLKIVRVNFRKLGWFQWHSDGNVKRGAEQALGTVQ